MPRQMVQFVHVKDCSSQFIFQYLVQTVFQYLNKKCCPLEESARSVRACITVISLTFPLLFTSPRLQVIVSHQVFSIPCRKHSTRQLTTTRRWGRTVRNPGLFKVDYKNAIVIVMGPGLDTWARLCSTHKFLMILGLKTWGREEEKGEESSALCPLESGLSWLLTQIQMPPSAVCTDPNTALKPH